MVYMNAVPKAEKIRLKGKAYKDLQKAVLERDNHACQDCGRYTNAPPHHKVFRSQGGSDTLENLITLCGPLEVDCHAKMHR